MFGLACSESDAARAVVLKAISEGIEVFGINRGYAGMVEGVIMEVTMEVTMVTAIVTTMVAIQNQALASGGA